jgi:N-methyl-L-tryptophan oxidase
MNHYDVILVGTGSMGVSSAAYLGMSGIKVLALDPYKGPHDHGSHSGKTRIGRQIQNQKFIIRPD